MGGGSTPIGAENAMYTVSVGYGCSGYTVFRIGTEGLYHEFPVRFWFFRQWEESKRQDSCCKPSEGGIVRPEKLDFFL